MTALAYCQQLSRLWIGATTKDQSTQKKGNWVDEGMRDLKFGAAVEKVVEAVRSLRTIYAPQPGRLSDTQNKAITGCSYVEINHLFWFATKVELQMYS